MNPKIDSPCPLKSIDIPNEPTFYCGHCSRTVHNFDHLSSQDRKQLAKQCNQGKICVTYKVKQHLRSTAAIAGLFLVSAGGQAIAAESVNLVDNAQPSVKDCDDVKQLRSENVGINNAIDTDVLDMTEVVLVGGVSKFTAEESPREDDSDSLKMIPVVSVD